VNEAEIELGFRATSARRAVRNRAKLVASIDQVSHGRFLFGVGGGWNQDEIDMGLAHHRLSLTAQLQ
jgi:alkanesulfonate monooxygenase SsuD/methylene tetrahydromethanopterin reductase-like flavin-dependent oxidoreductase (luciferase family)